MTGIKTQRCRIEWKTTMTLIKDSVPGTYRHLQQIIPNLPIYVFLFFYIYINKKDKKMFLWLQEAVCQLQTIVPRIFMNWCCAAGNMTPGNVQASALCTKISPVSGRDIDNSRWFYCMFCLPGQAPEAGLIYHCTICVMHVLIRSEGCNVIINGAVPLLRADNKTHRHFLFTWCQ